MMDQVPKRNIVRAYGKLEKLEEYRVKWLARLVYSQSFELFVAFVIALNAVALALLTFSDLSDEARNAAILADSVCLWIYMTELALRIISYGRKPWEFFRRGWNIFDFVVIASTPLFAGQTAILRVLRLFRLLRIFRFLPEVRILSASIIKSLPPLLSMGALITLLLFLYGMVGYYLFGASLPEAWGSIAASMMSLIILLTLENFPIYLEDAIEVSSLALPFLISYVFIIVFTVLNLLIGIVLNAMDEARNEAKVYSDKNDPFESLSENIELLGSDGSISESELRKLKTEIRRLRTIAGK